MALPRFPSVSELLESPSIKKLLDTASHNTVVSGVQTFLDQVRGEIQTATENAPSVSDLADRIARWMAKASGGGIHSVVNATGVVLSQDLGRAPLAPDALEHAVAAAGGYCDLSEGDSHQVEAALQQLTGAEAALVVNHHASATLLALSIATGKELIVARGEVVELGDCRLTDICHQSGAKLREVGATHRTELADYRDAVSSEAGAILRVECSGFQMVGDTAQASTAELAQLAHRRRLPLIVCNEAGAVIDVRKYGIQMPTTQEILADGADVVTLTGDQLLGGPQCGIVLGRRELVNRMRQHPLAPMLQVGKLTLGALDGTLRLYRSPDNLEQTLPLLQLISTSEANLRHRAERLAPQLLALDAVREATAVDGVACLTAQVPLQQINTSCVGVIPATISPEQMMQKLRDHTPAVWTRVQNGQVWVDLRTVNPSEDELLLNAFRSL